MLHNINENFKFPSFWAIQCEVFLLKNSLRLVYLIKWRYSLGFILLPGYSLVNIVLVWVIFINKKRMSNDNKSELFVKWTNF